MSLLKINFLKLVETSKNEKDVVLLVIVRRLRGPKETAHMVWGLGVKAYFSLIV